MKRILLLLFIALLINACFLMVQANPVIVEQDAQTTQLKNGEKHQVHIR